jgi:cytochrome c peroxidase
MIKRRFFCVALVGLCGALVGVALLYDSARADVLGGPLPAPRMPRDIIGLTPVEKLGKLMLYDSTLSNPPGYSCATCHSAIQAGVWPGCLPKVHSEADLRTLC